MGNRRLVRGHRAYPGSHVRPQPVESCPSSIDFATQSRYPLNEQLSQVSALWCYRLPQRHPDVCDAPTSTERLGHRASPHLRTYLGIYHETYTSIPLFARNATPRAEQDRERCGACPGAAYKRGRFQRGEKWPRARSARTHRLEEIVCVEPQLAGGAAPGSAGCNNDLVLRESAALAEWPRALIAQSRPPS